MQSLESCVGREVVLWYPQSGQNRASIVPQLTARRVRVERVRDTFASPIAPETLAARPDLLRSRYLCVCWDVRKQAYRSFYAGSARVVAAAVRYQVTTVADVEPETLHETRDLATAADIAARLAPLVEPHGVRTLLTVQLE